jgi:ABC-type polar amino acid transport system ATPase subunit
MVEVVTALGRTLALDGVSLDVAAGEVVAIMGPSGCGKSTLLRCINGLTPHDSGDVVVMGRLVERDHDSLRAARLATGMVFQHFELFAHLTVGQNVWVPYRLVSQQSAETCRAEAQAALEALGLGSEFDRYPAELSTGEQQRVAVARAMIGNPSVLLCDEPTAAVDPELTRSVLGAITETLVERTVLIVTHEVRFIASVADRVVMMDRGRVIEEGPALDVLTQPRQRRTRAFLDAVAAVAPSDADAIMRAHEVRADHAPWRPR